MTRIKIILKSGKDQSLRRFHPWIFSGAIKKIEGNPAEGEQVDIYTNNDEFLATGHYQNGSIAIRVIAFENRDADQEFWNEKIRNAYLFRQNMGLTNSSSTTVYRLIHGEGDNLPGLIVDYYDNNLVIQVHSAGMFRNLEKISHALQELYSGSIRCIFNKSGSTLPFMDAKETANHFILGDTAGCTVKENDLQFKVNWVEGQKTGFFIDQRENRMLVRRFAQDRKVLNVFSYTGGFSVYALSGGAEMVHSVDSSEKSVLLGDENIALNFTKANHTSYTTDAFKFLAGIRDTYDMIILDPPAFAKHQSALHNALQGYKRMNQVALEKICHGGILFTYSCSQVVTRENFRKSVFAAAANARRNVRILYQLTQPVDHPVNIYHPESEYLKGLVLYVE